MIRSRSFGAAALFFFAARFWAFLPFDFFDGFVFGLVFDFLVAM